MTHWEMHGTSLWILLHCRLVSVCRERGCGEGGRGREGEHERMKVGGREGKEWNREEGEGSVEGGIGFIHVGYVSYFSESDCVL